MQNPATGVFTLTLADGTQKVFNAQNVLAAIIDRNNNQTTIVYDSSNRITSVASPTSAGWSENWDVSESKPLVFNMGLSNSLNSDE